ncbi:hypothetical protein LEMLEM_LOCUS18922, partial [Lemmus lemmus]
CARLALSLGRAAGPSAGRPGWRAQERRRARTRGGVMPPPLPDENPALPPGSRRWQAWECGRLPIERVSPCSLGWIQAPENLPALGSRARVLQE